jgi:exodeoxyribonuclease-3
VHDPMLCERKVLFSEPERAAFRSLLGLGLQDSFRLFELAGEIVQVVGLPHERLQAQSGSAHRLHSGEQGAGCRAKASRIDKSMHALERPSDHASVVTELAA